MPGCAFRLFAVAGIFQCGVGATSADLAPSAKYSAEELRARLHKSQAAVRSFHVVYRAQGNVADGAPRSMYVRREIAAKAPCFLFYHNTHGCDWFDWRDDPLQKKAYLTANRLYSESSLNRIYYDVEYPPDGALPRSLQGELFFEFTGLWPFDSRPAPRPFGRVHVLPEVALSADYSIVRTYQETTDGRWCHVLENPAIDYLWLDAERGCCLLARELYDPATRRLITRLELGGHREVASGIWLPSWIKSIQYDFGARTDQQSTRKVTDSRIDILSIKVNDVADSVFEFHPRPGSLLYRADDPNSQPTQTQPGGLEHLDNLVEWTKRYHPPETNAFGGALGYCGCLAGVPFLAVIVYCEIRRRNKASPRHSLTRTRCLSGPGSPGKPVGHKCDG